MTVISSAFLCPAALLLLYCHQADGPRQTDLGTPGAGQHALAGHACR